MGSMVRSMTVLRHGKRFRLALAAAAIGLASATLAQPVAAAEVRVRLQQLDGFESPGTPPQLNKVGVLQIGPKSAKNVLVLNPGHVGERGVLRAARQDRRAKAKGWQVWAVERRENLLEDHSVLDRAKAGHRHRPGAVRLLPRVAHRPEHHDALPVHPGRRRRVRARVGHARRDRGPAPRGPAGGEGRAQGSSSAATRSAARSPPPTPPGTSTGKAGAEDLAGLVFIDGGSGPTPVTPEQATASLARAADRLAVAHLRRHPRSVRRPLQRDRLDSARSLDPDAPSLGQALPLLPANLKPPIPVTNLAQYGYALDTETSPPSLIAAQAHLGHLAASGDPRGWDQAGEITPIQRFAEMFSGFGLQGLDGTAWYHPQRLTIDSGAVAAGNANPAQAILDVRATHGHDLPKDLRIYAFGAALGGQRVLDAATNLAKQSQHPDREPDADRPPRDVLAQRSRTRRSRRTTSWTAW